MDLIDHFVRQFSLFQIFKTCFRADCEALRDRKSDSCHFRKVRAFASKQISLVSVSFAEHINPLFSHHCLLQISCNMKIFHLLRCYVNKYNIEIKNVKDFYVRNLTIILHDYKRILSAIFYFRTNISTKLLNTDQIFNLCEQFIADSRNLLDLFF